MLDLLMLLLLNLHDIGVNEDYIKRSRQTDKVTEYRRAYYRAALYWTKSYVYTLMES